jgi:hypothetical protein
LKPLAWAAVAGVVTGGILLLTRKAKADTMPNETPTKFYGETTRVALAVPSGWRRATNADLATAPDLADHAVALRNTSGFTSMQYGTLTPFVASDGKTYATWVEQHYHEPLGPVKPWGLHHGVTLLASL